MARPEFEVPEFVSESDSDQIQERMMGNLPADISDMEGDFPYDFTMPTAIEISQLVQFNLVRCLMVAFPEYSWYDSIIAECTTGDLCTDAEGRWARMYDAEKLVMDDAVIFPLYTQANAEMMSSSVTGVDFHPCALNRVYKNAVKSE